MSCPAYVTVPKIGNLNGIDLTNVTIIGGTITGTTLTNVTINNSTMNNSTITNPTITGGTMTGTTLTNVIINNPTITGGTITGTTLINATLTSPTITNPTVTGGSFTNSSFTNVNVSGGTINNATINTPILNNPTLSSPLINGSLIFQNGFVISQTGPGPTLNFDGNINFGSVPGSPNVNLDFTNATSIVGLVRTASVVQLSSVNPLDNVVQQSTRLDLCRIDKMVIMRCTGNLVGNVQNTSNFEWPGIVPAAYRPNQNVCHSCPTEWTRNMSPAPDARWYNGKAIIPANGDLIVAGEWEVGRTVNMNAGWCMCWWTGPFV